MKALIEQYHEDLLMVFEKNADPEGRVIAVIRNGVEKKEIPGVLSLHYNEDFESLLGYKIPPKTRKPAKLLSYEKTWAVLKKEIHGVIGCIIDDLPYAYGMNYLVIDGRIYFHTGYKGYKLKAMNTTASFNVMEDLGLSYNGSHNFRSVQIQGTLKVVEDPAIKLAVLETMIRDINPNHAPIAEAQLKSTLIYEIETDYMMGRENLYLPGDGK